MRLGARVIDYSTGIFKFSPNFLRFGTRGYCYTVEEMSVSSRYWIKWLQLVTLFEFNRVFFHASTFAFHFHLLWTISSVSCAKCKYAVQNAIILSTGFIERK